MIVPKFMSVPHEKNRDKLNFMDSSADFLKLQTWLSGQAPCFGLWDLNWASQGESLFLTLLSKEEQKIYQGFSKSKRAAEFLAGRVILKACLTGVQHRMPQIEILNQDSGRPFLKIDQKKQPRPYFSLSHKDSLILAAADPLSPLGVDIEKISLRPKKLKAYFLSAAEERVLTDSGLDEAHALTFLWAARESLVKLTGLDFMGVSRKFLLIQALPEKMVFQKGRVFFKVCGYVYREYVFCVARRLKKGEEA